MWVKLVKFGVNRSSQISEGQPDRSGPVLTFR